MYPSSCWKSQIHLVTLSSPTAGSSAPVVVVVTTTSLSPAAALASAVVGPASSSGRPTSPADPAPSLVGGDGGASGDNGGVHGSGAV